MEEMTCPSILPPGFRFHPTDEELIVYYLENQAMSNPCPASIIPELDIYKFDPWQLPTEMTGFGGNERYFFTPREKKYPNGSRPNRATLSGYWKATGTDKAIYSGARFVGIKKALVFYKGRPPKGTKTDWIMHEYKLNDPPRAHRQMISTPGSMKLDDWVLCRIYKRRRVGRLLEQKEEEEEEDHQPHQTPPVDVISAAVKNEHSGGGNQQPTSTFTFSHPSEPDYFGPISHLLNDADDGSLSFSYNDLENFGFDPDRNGFGSTASNSEFRLP